MVSRKTTKRKAVKKAKKKSFFKIIFLCIIIALLSAFITYATLVYFRKKSEETQEDYTEQETETEEPEPEPEIIISKIDFQPTIDKWVNSVNGKKGIIIYDLDLDEVVGSYNADQKFQTASIYKLFVVYEGYRRIQNGTWDRDEAIGWMRKSILECLDLAIRESNSSCAETLWNMIGHEELNYIAQTDFEMPNLIVSYLTATPTEIMKMMKIFYEHTEITDESLISVMKDSFLNQPITTYNWRQGLPSGFTGRVNVYNKVGWNYDGEKWTIYDDAAILDFINENRHFIAVVMTSGINYPFIRRLGNEIEAAFYNQNVLKN